MIGILNEKSSQAENFAKALGGSQISGAPRNFFKGNYNGEDFIIVHAHGHLYQYKDPHEMVKSNLVNKYKSWEAKYLPWDWRDLDFSYKMIPGSSSLVRAIKQYLSKCDEITIATDDDPSGEGEKLAWEVLDQTHLAPEKWSRMYFADEEAKSVIKAFNNRKPKISMMKDPDMLEAVLRARRDFLSMQWTRMATQAVMNRAVLRQGRLKTLFVVLVGDQFKKIKAYKKIPSYSQRYQDENGNVFVYKDAETFPKPNMVKLDAPGKVVIDKRVKKHQVPPKMYDLTNLSTELEEHYGVSTKTTLATYQKMYEAKVVSYPRTEDKVVSHEQFNAMLPNIDAIADLVGVDKTLLTHRSPRPTHVKDGGTHGANRPGPVVPKNLDDLDSKFGRGAKAIYTILAKNYLASLAEDYIYEQVTAHVDGNNNYTASTNLPISAGYKKIFAGQNVTKVGKQFGQIAKPFVYEGFPPKPAKPTMKWLFAQLSKYDVGTGATQASTYADVTNSRAKYPLLKASRGKITLTNYGAWSYEVMKNTALADVELTQKWNQDMKKVRKGEAGLNEIGKWLDDEADLIVRDRDIIAQNALALRKKEGITAMNTDKIEGQWTDVDGETKDVHFGKVYRNHTWTDEEIQKLLDGEHLTVEFTSKAGKPYKMDCYIGHNEFENAKGETIKYIGICSEFVKTEKDVDDEWCKHKFTESEKEALRAGKAVTADDFVGKSGKKFSCSVTWGDKEWNGHKFKGIIPKFN